MCKKILYFSQDFLSSIHFQHRFQNSCCQFQLCFPSSELQFCHLALRLYCTLTSRNLLKAYSYNYRNLELDYKILMILFLNKNKSR